MQEIRLLCLISDGEKNDGGLGEGDSGRDIYKGRDLRNI